MTEHPDSMLPVIRQMHEADGDRERALILLQVSDAVLLKYREAFKQACRRAAFDIGLTYIEVRRAAFHAVRGPDGRHKKLFIEEARAALAAFAGTGAP